MAERAGSSLGYITSKALGGDRSPKEVSMETASFADRHNVALVIIETVFLGRMGLHRGQQINISVGIGQTLSDDILSLV